MLNARQLRFIDEYVVSLNATKAAIRAGYSRKTARAIGSENLRKSDIASEISRRLKRSRQRSEKEGQRVIEELSRIAFANIGVIVDSNGVKRPEEWPREIWDAIKSVRYRETLGPAGADGKKPRLSYRASITMRDKIRALRLLAAYLGMIPPRQRAPRKVSNR
jgi:phage terminase small subunit